MAEATPVIPGRIFVSYRRDETDFPASWLYERLALHFGREQVFKDVDSIELGDDFAEVIAVAVASCDVLLALIGAQWLTIADESGTPRLENPDDFVRLEIEAALQRNVRVIPILVGDARMPRADQLPRSLTKLARRQALALNPHRFEADTRRLVQVVEKTIADQELQRETERAARRAAEVADNQQRVRQAAEDQARRRAEQEAAEEQTRLTQAAEAEDRRLASIGGLAGSLGRGDQAATAAALAALRRFAEDDSQPVASAARKVLADWDANQRPPAEAAQPVVGAWGSQRGGQQSLPARVTPSDSSATAALVLAIVGLVFCPVLGIVAIVMANNSTKRIQASNGMVGGLALANAARIVGIAGLVLWLIILIVAVVLNGNGSLS